MRVVDGEFGADVFVIAAVDVIIAAKTRMTANILQVLVLT
jgi:hypothetical protein